MRNVVGFRHLLVILFAGALSLDTAFANDVPQTFTLDGQLFGDVTGTAPLLDSSIGLKIQILDEDKICILYEETQSISTLASKGYFTVQVGSATGNAKRTVDDSANTMAGVFQNINAVTGKLLSNGAACVVPPTAGDRRYVRIAISPSSLGGAPRTLSPDLTIDSVPNAVVAERAESIQGFRSSDLLKVNTASGAALTQTNLESLFSSTTRFNSLTAVVDGTSSSYMRSNSTSGANLPVLAGAPTGPAVGSIWYDSTDSRVKFQTGSGPVSVGSGSGSVTSVGFTAPAELTVTGGPVTSSGTIAVTWASQTANRVLASPNGSAGAPSFRALVAADVPFAVQNSGGTPSLQSGLDAAKGAAATAGRVWIATDTRLVYRDTGTVWETIGDGGGGGPTGTAGGDLNGTYPNPTVDGIQGVAISAVAPTDGQVLRYTSTGTQWAPANFSAADLRTPGGASQFASATCAASQTTTWSSLTNTFTCIDIAGLAASTITSGTIDIARLPGAVQYWTAATGGINYAGGNVGIGTTTPGSALSLTSSGQIQFGSNSFFSSDGAGTFALGFSPASSNANLRVQYLQYVRGLRGYFAVGTNTAGLDLDISPQISTGNAAGGSLIINTSPAGAPGSSANSLVEAMRVTSAGNVGIGTASPGAKLDVSGSGGTRFHVTDTTSQAAGIRMISNSYNWYIDNRGGNDTPFNRMAIYNNSATEVMTILPSGNFGIGTNSPGALLQLGTAGNSLGTFRMTGNTSGYVQLQPAAAAGSWTMTLPSGAGTSGQVLQTNGSGVTSWASVPTTGGTFLAADGTNTAPSYSFSNDTDTGMYRSAADEITFVTGTNTKAWINNAGLSVSGDLTGYKWSNQVYTPTGATGGPEGYVFSSANTSNTTGSATTISLNARNDSTTVQSAYIGAVSNSSGNAPTIVIGQQTAASAYAERMRIDASGNVGIGTATPTARLDLGSGAAGNYLRANGGSFNVDNNGNVEANYITAIVGGYQFENGGSPSMLITRSGSGASAAMAFSTGGSGSIAERLRINGAGNVGIGTTAPGALLQLGTAGTSLGTFRMTGNTSGFVQLQPAAAAGSWTMTLPTGAGSSGQVLTTDGAGVTSWTTVSGGGGITSLGGQSGASQTFAAGAAGNAPAIASASNIHTLNVPLASASGTVTSGTISNADYVSFAAKLTSPLTTKGDLLTRTATVEARLPVGTDGQVLVPDALEVTGLRWTNFSAANLRTAGGASQFASATCSSSQTTTWSSLTNTFTCVDIAGLAGSVITSGTIDIARLPAGAQYWTAATGGINYAGGLVGIGTTTPSAPLTMYSNNAAGSTAQIRIQQDGSGDALTQFMIGATSGYSIGVDNSDGDKLKIGSSSSAYPGVDTGTLMTWDKATGFVGIGTTSPAAPLVVQRDGAGTIDSLVIKNNTANTFGSTSLKFEGAAAVPMGRIQAMWDGNQLFSTLRFSTVAVGVEYERMKLNGGGSLFVGQDGAAEPWGRMTLSDNSASPNSVVDSLILSQRSTSGTGTSSGVGTRIRFIAETSAANTYANTGVIEGVLDDATNTSKDSSLRFFTLGPNAGAGSNTGTEKLRIDSSGNVGIGMTAPNTILDINGAFSMREMAAPAVAPLDQGRIYFDSTANKFRVSENNGAYTDLVGGAGATTLDGLTDAVRSGTNIFLGVGVGASTSGASNTGLGALSLQSLTTGYNNVAIGAETLRQNTDGYSNVAVGREALNQNVSGDQNTALGMYTLPVATGNDNTALGNAALAALTTTDHNTAVGSGALGQITNAVGNTALGYRAGRTATTNSYGNVFLGYNAGPTANTTLNNSLWIGNASGTPLIYGDFSTARVGIGTTSPSSPFHVRKTAVLSTDPDNIQQNYMQSTSSTSSKTVTYSRMDYAPAAPTSSALSQNANFSMVFSNSSNVTSNDSLYGASSQAIYGGTGTVGSLWGMNADLYNTSTGTVVTARAIKGVSYNGGAGTINNSWGAQFVSTNTSTGTIGTNYGVEIQSPSNSGNYTTNYGLYISDQTLTNASSEFSIYANGGRSYFRDDVGIGTTSPVSKLEVVGNVTASSTSTTEDVLVEAKHVANTAAYSGGIQFLKARGVASHPLSGDQLGFVRAQNAVNPNSWPGMYIYATQNQSAVAQGSAITFQTTANGTVGGTERVRIDQNGNVGIGNTSPARLLHVGSASVGTGIPVANFQNVDGTCTLTPASSGSGIACSSDERLKENFQDVTGEFALDRILRLQAVTYNFKTSSDDNRRTGYKAQEVQKVAPEFVRENEDGLLQVYYDAFIPWITEAVKTLYSRVTGVEKHQLAQDREIASVKAENEKLKQENADIKARLEKIEKALSAK